METRVTFRQRQSGFTLIELMVVVAIIGILSSLAVPVLSEYRDTARIAAAKAFGQQILSAFAAYRANSLGNTLPDFATCDELAQVVTNNGHYFSPDKQDQYCPSGVAITTPGIGHSGKLCICKDNNGQSIDYECLGVVPPGCTPRIQDLVVTLPIHDVRSDLYIVASTVAGVEVVKGTELPFDGWILPVGAGPLGP